MVAIVRRCYSAASAPRIGCLAPHIKSDYEVSMPQFDLSEGPMILYPPSLLPVLSPSPNIHTHTDTHTHTHTHTHTFHLCLHIMLLHTILLHTTHLHITLLHTTHLHTILLLTTLLHTTFLHTILLHTILLHITLLNTTVLHLHTTLLHTQPIAESPVSFKSQMGGVGCFGACSSTFISLITYMCIPYSIMSVQYTHHNV